jgi:hypothetical protein
MTPEQIAAYTAALEEGEQLGRIAQPNASQVASLAFESIAPPPPPTTRNPLAAFTSGLTSRGTAASTLLPLDTMDEYLKGVTGREYSPRDYLPAESEGWLPSAAEIGYATGSVAGRLPMYAAGGKAAGLVARPLGGAIAGSGAPAWLGALASRALQGAGTFGIGDLMAEAGAQTKEYVADDIPIRPGEMGRELGHGAVIGALLGPAGFGKGPIRKKLAEAAGLEAGGMILERRGPTFKSYLTNLAVIGTLHAGGVLKGDRPGADPGIMRQWKSMVQGFKSARTLKAAKEVDPKIAEVLLRGAEAAQNGDAQFSALLLDFMPPKLQERYVEAQRHLNELQEAEAQGIVDPKRAEQIASTEAVLEGIETEIAEQHHAF